EFSTRLICPSHNLLGNGCSFCSVGVQECGIRVLIEYCCEFPREVIGILNRSIRPKTVARWMFMYGISHGKDATRLKIGRILFIIAPQRDTSNLSIEVWCSDQVAHDFKRVVVGKLWHALTDIKAPGDQPFIPWSDHTNQASTDATDIGTGLYHPV